LARDLAGLRDAREAVAHGDGPCEKRAMTDDDEVLQAADRWRAAGKAVALATVVRTWASAPRPVGSHLAVNEDGLFAGSVSGGCVEGEVIEHARDVMQRGFPRVLEFGVSDDRAWEVGLACGGAIQVYVERVE